VEAFTHSLNTSSPGSNLRVQFQADPRYADFVERASIREVLGQKDRLYQLQYSPGSSPNRGTARLQPAANHPEGSEKLYQQGWTPMIEASPHPLVLEQPLRFRRQIAFAILGPEWVRSHERTRSANR
jgi:hypothetical protein